MRTGRRNRITRKKPAEMSSLCATNPKLSDLGSNSGRRSTHILLNYFCRFITKTNVAKDV
jgi:hypothetical protein